MTVVFEKPTETSSPGRASPALVATGIAALLLATILLAAWLTGASGLTNDFQARLQPPSWQHLFGTDMFGRDVLARTIKGLALSFRVGFLAAGISVVIATGLAILAASGSRLADSVVSLLVDMTMGLPHLVLLILISFALGGGTGAVIIAVAVTHWPRLTRILRAEILQLRNADYVVASRNFGKSRWFIARHHILPHLIPQMIVGFVLLFPHAILHEAGLTFLGFGLEPGKPAIGILLSESMRYLMAGKWWLGLFPGLALLVAVLCFDIIGNGLRALTDPRGGRA
jgi:peptide/nickel transport system permease protein